MNNHSRPTVGSGDSVADRNYQANWGGIDWHPSAPIPKPVMSKKDRDLLGYLHLHCQTELGLVEVNHLRRLYELAGVEAPDELKWRTWWNTSPSWIDPLIGEARNRHQEKQNG